MFGSHILYCILNLDGLFFFFFYEKQNIICIQFLTLDRKYKLLEREGRLYNIISLVYHNE